MIPATIGAIASSTASSTIPAPIIPQVIMSFYIPSTQDCTDTPTGFAYASDMTTTGPGSGINYAISNLPTFGSQFAHNGVDTWVSVVGSSIYSSKDASNWTLRSTNQGGIDQNLKYFNGYFMVLDGSRSASAVQYSADGINWTVAKVDQPANSANGIYQVLNVSYANGYWFFGGLNSGGGYAWSYSAPHPPTSWTSATSGDAASLVSFSAISFTNVSYLNGVWAWNVPSQQQIQSSSARPSSSITPAQIFSYNTVTQISGAQIVSTSTAFIISYPLSYAPNKNIITASGLSSGSLVVGAPYAISSALPAALAAVYNNRIYAMSNSFQVCYTNSASPSSSTSWNVSTANNSATHDTVQTHLPYQNPRLPNGMCLS
jgi:hypothetical protein